MGLILTVGRGDKITIGDDITATIQRFSGGGVKILFDAPTSVLISRTMVERDTNLAKANRLTPENQLEIALTKFNNRGNKR